MTLAICVESLSKRYQLGSDTQGGYRTFRESIANVATAAVGRIRGRFGDKDANAERRTDLWALEDVSFDIPQGEVVGIIGRNGAGKSTLLKILSRITEPTSGRIEVRGRLGSLLEVGTGFHPELTGRENIFLNGAILGMTRKEVLRKFDDIVAFAEVEQFIDTPVKRYSSGMYVRLAFAVAAHLEPEILLVDEVLAVGDLAFQKKCLGRMSELGSKGRTVLFVSHNMAAISALCGKALVLDKGKMSSYGDAREQIQLFMACLNKRSASVLSERSDRIGSGVARVVNISFLANSGQLVETVVSGEPFTIRFEYKGSKPLTNVEIFAWLTNDEGRRVTSLSNRYTGHTMDRCPSQGALECHIPRFALAPGTYLLDFTLLIGLNVVDHVLGAASITLEPGSFFPTGRIPPKENGVFLTDHRWTVCGDPALSKQPE